LHAAPTITSSRLTYSQIHNYSKVIVWILIAVYAIVPIGNHAFGSKVICIENDGHFSLESVTGIRCTAAQDQLSGAKSTSTHHESHFAVDEGHCNDCVDILISSGDDPDCTASVSTRNIEVRNLVTEIRNGFFTRALGSFDSDLSSGSYKFTSVNRHVELLSIVVLTI